jgi:SAM-dependent methyltransferase
MPSGFHRSIQLGLLRVAEHRIQYTSPPDDIEGYTGRAVRFYSKYAHFYCIFLVMFPIWKIWIGKVLPYIKGERILEVSFGSGYLMAKYARGRTVHGADISSRMVSTARAYLLRRRVHAELLRADVRCLPYEDGSFDTVVNTMSFTGYADGARALAEIHRVLKTNGNLILVDIDYPENRNIVGYIFAKIMEYGGDVLRDIRRELIESGFTVRAKAVGGFGSVKLFICKKR